MKILYWAALSQAIFAQSPKSIPGPNRVFEVASIRRGCPGKVGPHGPPPSWLDPRNAGHVTVCFTSSNLITTAYFTYANDRVNPNTLLPPLAGDAPWVSSDQYMLDARADPKTPQEVMHGSMLRALLEDRFKLKVHRETRQVPVYALTIAKGGPKLERFQEGTCLPFDNSKPFDPQRTCDGRRVRKGANVALISKGGTLAEFAISFGMDRPVLDETGLTGRFNLRLEFTPDFSTPAYMAGGSLADAAAAPSDAAAPGDPAGGISIFTALREQLGLQLQAAKGPRQFIVIDRVNRPSQN